MVPVTVRYEGQLRCRAVHGPSGTAIHTDAPVDNHGKGESFSPTDLLAAALPACMMTIMGIVADRHGIDLVGMTARCEKVMATDPPRRIAALRTVIEVPIAASHPHRAALENAAHTCPVHKSLRADLDAIAAPRFSRRISLDPFDPNRPRLARLPLADVVGGGPAGR